MRGSWIMMTLAAGLASLWATAASAQTLPGLAPVDRIGAARLTLSDGCPLHDAAEEARWAVEKARLDADLEVRIAALMAEDPDLTREAAIDKIHEQDGIVVTGSAGLFMPIIAGLVGDVATAAVNAGAGALEEASKARAVGAAGAAVFEFYDLGWSRAAVDLRPNLGPGSDNACIIFESLASGTGAPGSAPTPAVYAEIALVPLRDGVSAQPVYIDYRAALPGAPDRKALPSELHVELSLPGSVTNGVYSGRVFGLARISLPDLRPGDTREGPELGVAGELLPFRPEEGGIAAARTALAATPVLRDREEGLRVARLKYLAALGQTFPADTDRDSVDGLLEAFTCEIDPEAGNGPSEAGRAADKEPTCADRRAALAALEARAGTSDEAVKSARTAMNAAMGAWIGAVAVPEPSEARVQAGSTTVRVRFVLVKNENRFGTAIAAALKARAPAMGTAVAGQIGPEAWTAQQSEVIKAQLKVNRAQAALATAQAGTDTTALREAEDALVSAKLELNVAAQAAGQSIPYPGLSALPRT